MKDINKLEEFWHKDSAQLTPFQFIKNSQIFSNAIIPSTARSETHISQDGTELSSDRVLDRAANKILQKNLAKDRVLFEIGDTFKGLYIVKSGIMKAIIGQSESNIVVGGLLGLEELVAFLSDRMCLLRRSYVEFKHSVKSVTDAELIFLEKELVESICRQNFDFFSQIYLTYYQRCILKTNVS